MKAKANEIDRHIGARLMLLRKKLGVPQAEITAALGVSTQQLQKYENGLTRLTASALFALATQFSVDLHFFFEGLAPAERSGAGFSEHASGYGDEPARPADGHLLDAAFAKIKSGRERALAIALVETVAQSQHR